MIRFNTNEAVRPLFGTRDGGSYGFAGTGFFIAHDGNTLLVTAYHVVDGLDLFVLDLPKRQTGSEIFTLEDLLKPAEVLASSVREDLAVLRVREFNPGTTLSLAETIPPSNQRVGTLEYSRFEWDLDQGTMSPNASTRIGNIVRLLNGDKKFPDDSLELSYPALRGASGSPVVTLGGPSYFEVCGIVVANAQYELMPVQTYEYRNADGAEEERTHYYLPSGVAINVHWLKQLLATLRTEAQPTAPSDGQRDKPEQPN